MKVILFTPEYPPRCGGVGYYVYYLARELFRIGVEPMVVIRGKVDRYVREDGIPLYEIDCPGVAPINYSWITGKIEALLNKLGGDLLHIHSSTMPLIKSRLPIMVTAHSNVAEATIKFHRPVKDLHALYRNLLLPVYRRVEGRLVRRCRLLTVVSQSLRNEFRKWYQVDSEVVGNGVDLERFQGTENKKGLALYVGMFTIGKGILDLIEAAPLVAKRFPDISINLIGTGSLRRHLLGKIKRNNVQNVKIIDHKPHSELIKYYQESLLFVLPSHYEGLPTTILEAMACGLPVVATEVGGIPDQVEDGVTGFLVPPGRPDLLADRICRLLADASLRDEMGRRGRLKVEKKFTWQRVGEKFITLYKSLAGA